MKESVIESYVKSKLGDACLEVFLELDGKIAVVIVKPGTSGDECVVVNAALKKYFHVHPIMTFSREMAQMIVASYPAELLQPPPKKTKRWGDDEEVEF
jgi:hypothetical protein